MSEFADENPSTPRLVIFGCGYVGAAVAARALREGVRVVALTRNQLKAESLRAQGVEVVVADLAEKSWHEQIRGRVDWVLNAVSSGGGGVDGYRHSYLGGMRSISEWARTQVRVGTLAYTSSTSVYPHDRGVVVDETAATSEANDRSRILLETEALVKACFAENACERYFILRLAGIYGPGREHLVEQVRSGEVAGHGEHRLNLAHRDDIAAAIWSVFRAPPSIANEVFNVADDAPASKAEVAGWIANQLGLPPPRFTGAPAGGRRAVTPDRVIANTKLKTMLGWKPAFPSFREGYAASL